MFTVAKHDGRLAFVDRGGYQSRNASTRWCIEEADRLHDFGDFDAVEVWTGDCEASASGYCYSHVQSFANTVPDFNFHRWAEAGVDDYEDTCAALAAAGEKPAATDRAGWIGALSHGSRKTLHDLRDPALLDVTLMEWRPAAPGATRLPASAFVSLPDLAAKYAYLVDVEGSGYSGRLKYLLHSGRPVLLADRPHLEFFYEHLRAWDHYVPVRRDLGDLHEKIRWLQAHPAEAAAIARRASSSRAPTSRARRRGAALARRARAPRRPARRAAAERALRRGGAATSSTARRTAAAP
ncbi:glucosyltransferase [Aureococcus anophagefferens]|uniref:Glucosyltransferase n=1 Tax=Aureococcus anophagefferens TaxID=44056 RepID=A0ABR1FMW8_AURAN